MIVHRRARSIRREAPLHRACHTMALEYATPARARQLDLRNRANTLACCGRGAGEPSKLGSHAEGPGGGGRGWQGRSASAPVRCGLHLARRLRESESDGRVSFPQTKPTMENTIATKDGGRKHDYAQLASEKRGDASAALFLGVLPRPWRFTFPCQPVEKICRQSHA